MSSYCAGKQAAVSSSVVNHLLVPSHDFALRSPAPKKWWEPKEAEHNGEQRWEDASNKLERFQRSSEASRKVSTHNYANYDNHPRVPRPSTSQSGSSRSSLSSETSISAPICDDRKPLQISVSCCTSSFETFSTVTPGPNSKKSFPNSVSLPRELLIDEDDLSDQPEHRANDLVYSRRYTPPTDVRPGSAKSFVLPRDEPPTNLPDQSQSHPTSHWAKVALCRRSYSIAEHPQGSPLTPIRVPLSPKDSLPELHTPNNFMKKSRTQSMDLRTKSNEGGNDLQPLISRPRSTGLPLISTTSAEFWKPLPLNRTAPDYAAIRLQEVLQHFARDAVPVKQEQEKVADSSTRGDLGCKTRCVPGLCQPGRRRDSSLPQTSGSPSGDPSQHPVSNRPSLEDTEALELLDITRPGRAGWGAEMVPSGFREERTRVVGGCTVVEFVPIRPAPDDNQLPLWKKRVQKNMNTMRFVKAFQ